MSRRPAVVLAGVMSFVPWLPAPPAQSAAQATPDAQIQATLVVRLTAGKSTYFMGELIPVELEFAGQASDDYYFDARIRNRR